jgi:uracil phosphoribosyltransferase
MTAHPLHEVLRHALADHHLARLRARETDSAAFHADVHAVSLLLAAACSRDLPTTTTTIQTPLQSMNTRKISTRIALVPILRAGLGMVQGFRELLPFAAVHHIGIRRDEATAAPIPYYDLRRDQHPPDIAFVLDPMLATGGSAICAIRMLQEWGVQDIRMAAIIAAPEGLQAIAAHTPDVRVMTAALDEQLDENCYIRPGLGDAGDRLFGTT